MKFRSTRSNTCVAPSYALLHGLAPDGGLYVPETFPEQVLQYKDLAGKSYQEIASVVLSYFFTNFTDEERNTMIASAYNETTFRDERIVPLHSIDTDVSISELFHGRTLATLTATGQDVFHHDFGPFPGNFAYVPAGDFAALEKAADASACAVMMELVQGEGGVVALDADYVAKVAAFCKEKDILLIVDEVQTGVGRTGKFLACEHFDLHPDIVTLAKGLGGGLPIGAVVMNKKVAEHMKPGSHGSTFGGNPVCCAGALAVLDTMDEEFLANVNERAAQLRAGLAKLPHVQQVSGLGLMVGIAFDDGIKAADVRAACEKQGLLVLTAKTRLRLLPPLILTAEDVNAALDTLRTVLEKCV